MTALVVCHTCRGKQEDFRYFDFTQLYAVRWQKFADNWKITELRMDLTDHNGTDTEFDKFWFYENSRIVWFQGMYMHCVNGELDNPWHLIPDDETVLSEEEKILETMYTYAFGVDGAVFDNLERVLSPEVFISMQPWGILEDYKIDLFSRIYIT